MKVDHLVNLAYVELFLVVGLEAPRVETRIAKQLMAHSSSRHQYANECIVNVDFWRYFDIILLTKGLLQFVRDKVTHS